MESFWDRVASELDYLGMTNKALADKVGITASNIGKGIKTGAFPSVDTALKIARALNVSVEYLVTGSESPKGQNQNDDTEKIALYKKYAKLIEKLEALSSEKQKFIEKMLTEVKEL